MSTMATPRVVAIGGSTRPGSSTEQLLRLVIADLGVAAEVTTFCGPKLLLPHYTPAGVSSEGGDSVGHELIHAVRTADVVLIGSPGYHGSLSGAVKNALDYIEELAKDERPYLDGRVVACMSTAYGWQAAVNTLTSLRQIVAALRGWCAPYGIAINVADGYLDDNGVFRADRVAESIHILTAQIRDFLALRGRIPASV